MPSHVAALQGSSSEPQPLASRPDITATPVYMQEAPNSTLHLPLTDPSPASEVSSADLPQAPLSQACDTPRSPDNVSASKSTSSLAFLGGSSGGQDTSSAQAEAGCSVHSSRPLVASTAQQGEHHSQDIQPPQPQAKNPKRLTVRTDPPRVPPPDSTSALPPHAADLDAASVAAGSSSLRRRFSSVPRPRPSSMVSLPVPLAPDNEEFSSSRSSRRKSSWGSWNKRGFWSLRSRGTTQISNLPPRRPLGEHTYVGPLNDPTLTQAITGRHEQAGQPTSLMPQTASRIVRTGPVKDARIIAGYDENMSNTRRRYNLGPPPVAQPDLVPNFAVSRSVPLEMNLTKVCIASQAVAGDSHCPNTSFQEEIERLVQITPAVPQI